MYEFHYDYMIPRYKGRAKLCYMDKDSFVYHICAKDFYEYRARDVGSGFDTSVYKKEDRRPLPIGLNKKVMWMMKDELGVTSCQNFAH